MMDLSTTYLGMSLRNPIVPSASPLSYTLDGIRRLEDAGAGAVVLHSLFEEQIDAESEYVDHYLSYGTESYSEALSYFPEAQSYNLGPDGYLELIRSARESTQIPIIGSLNGVSGGGWIEYSRMMEQAGASAIELNLYYIPTDPEIDATEVETMYRDAVRRVRESVEIPIAVKIGPQFTALANLARALSREGADGLVLFNRFYQPDFDLSAFDVVPNLAWSRSEDLRLPLRWVALLYGRVPMDYAVTSGIHGHLDVLKAMMAGANVAMMASELLQNGVERIGAILKETISWMEENEYESIRQMHGSMSQQHVANPAAFERANYMKVLQSFRPDPAGIRL